jgi:FHA domain-containing protein
MGNSKGTDTDPAAENWSIHDRVTQLRIWGTEVVFPLAEVGDDEPIVGASPACAIRIDDPLISRLHARLVRSKRGWMVFDLESKNGIRLDGAQQAEGTLTPGTELGLGGVVLVAESAQLTALRGYLARLLGWSNACREYVDRALRSVRAAATRLVPLILSGQGELVSVASSLHGHVIGRDKPFILCDQRRRRAEADVRSVANISDPYQALRAAIGGSLCLLRRRMPQNTSPIRDEFSCPRPRVQIIICRGTDERAATDAWRTLSADPVVIPPLAERANEVDRIISEYATEALKEVGVAHMAFPEEDFDWVRSYSSSTLAEIEKGTRRLVALRAGGNVSSAAARLGMAAVSLSRWFGRRENIEEVRASRTKPRRSGRQGGEPRNRRGDRGGQRRGPRVVGNWITGSGE